MNGHWKKQFNYDYLGSYSLDGKREIVVSVKGVATAKGNRSKRTKGRLFCGTLQRV